MIIKALNDYYNILASDPESGIPLNGFCIAKVSHALEISKEGVLLGIIPLKQDVVRGKKTFKEDMNMIVPEQGKRSGQKPPPYFLCDTPYFVLGIKKEFDDAVDDLDNFDPFEKGNKYLASFIQLHKLLLSNSDNPLAQALLKFYQNYSYGKYKDIIEPHIKDLQTGKNIVFKIDNKYLHEDENLKKIWLKYSTAKNEELLVKQCAVTGKTDYIARVHPNIKGVANAQSSGATLVGFNADAYTSYNKIQSYNAPISQTVAFNYATVLNYMLSNQNQKIQIGNATTVFWAESNNNLYYDFTRAILNPEKSNENVNKKAEETINNLDLQNEIQSVLKNVNLGKIPDFNYLDEKLNLDKSTKFYVLGLSPNASRISVRFFNINDFGTFRNNLMQHYLDMQIEKSENDFDLIPVWRILKETVSPLATKQDPQPLLAGALMQSILCGTIYPRLLFSQIIDRVRTDKDDEKNKNIKINYPRVAVIKAYLSRFARLTDNKNLKEVLTMSLNQETNDTAYLLGRLFAVLEKAQIDALGKGINSTIKDRYFSSACATPGSVFPTLLKLSQSHISKSDYGYKSDNDIEEILAKLEDGKFPLHLSLEGQGKFIIGYYQQKKAFYVKQDKSIKGEN
jgi:CRISPR-associated protein Csd1